jgi:flagellar assembly factor FliW
MKIETTRFGPLDVAETELLSFPDGLLGFGEFRRFAVIDDADGGPFRWMQSVDEPSLAFVVTDPSLFFPDYRVRIRAEDLAPVGLKGVEDGRVLVILTLSSDASKITANLQGPLILNVAARLGRQIVLPDAGLSPRHRLMPEEAR